MYFIAVSSGARSLAARHRTHDEEGLDSLHHRVRERGVRLVVREILAAGEEAHEGPASLRHVVADRPAQHRVARLERVEDRALRGIAVDLELHLAVDARERAQVCGETDPDHGSVWTSTESTGGRSRTMGDQASPASAEA